MLVFEIEIEARGDDVFEGTVLADPGPNGALAGVRFHQEPKVPGGAPSLVLTKNGKPLMGRLLFASMQLGQPIGLAIALIEAKAEKDGAKSARFKVPILEEGEKLEPGMTPKALASQMNGLS